MFKTSPLSGTYNDRVFKINELGFPPVEHRAETLHVPESCCSQS